MDDRRGYPVGSIHGQIRKLRNNWLVGDACAWICPMQPLQSRVTLPLMSAEKAGKLIGAKIPLRPHSKVRLRTDMFATLGEEAHKIFVGVVALKFLGNCDVMERRQIRAFKSHSYSQMPKLLLQGKLTGPEEASDLELIGRR
ncbi:hypothetical protein MUK42_36241 [Musa troglodytarum]|uniref:Uncharacterized protein n=1 Tax=Musa troglodytarum TaxID=320322 RepID=A0A9E7JDB6_9LILI|nr:hypothetical protein MUK42_36241 [Musa troglodytarum]